MDWLAQIIAWLNGGMNSLGQLLSPLLVKLPGWLALTLLSAAAGLGAMIVFKYTSNQEAIGRVRDRIKAQLLALKLFKDNIPVVMQAQGRILVNALLLFIYSLRPTLVMIVPFMLTLGQIGLWYQARPLHLGEETVIVLQLGDSETDTLPQVQLSPSAAVNVSAGPVKIVSKRQILWKVQANQAGVHTLQFQVGSDRVEKELAAGEEPLRVSIKRPGLSVTDILIHPWEKPFPKQSPVRSIEIEYPTRMSRTFGMDRWILCFFGASIIFALLLKPFIRVKL